MEPESGSAYSELGSEIRGTSFDSPTERRKTEHRIGPNVENDTNFYIEHLFMVNIVQNFPAASYYDYDFTVRLG
jgi:hypothetical protein